MARIKDFKIIMKDYKIMKDYQLWFIYIGLHIWFIINIKYYKYTM